MSRKSGAGALQDRIAFDERVETADAYGGATAVWTERFVCAAQFLYQRGDERLAADRLEGRSVYKLKIRSSEASRAVGADWRVRDVRRGTVYNVREVDAVTDRAWVYLVVEAGVAT